MKIICAFDTHYGITRKSTLVTLVNEILAKSPDLIILGGDIGESISGIHQIREVLEMLGQGAFILGNHDIWSHHAGHYTSDILWNDLLPKLGSDLGWRYLENRNIIMNGVAIVGSYLHYDYSAADKEGIVAHHIRSNFPDWTPDEYYERMKRKVVNDDKYFIGMPRDKVFAHEIGEKFRARLLEAENDDSVHTIVIVTHVPCMPSQITRKPQEKHWSEATAYFGNLSHVPIIVNCSKVKVILSGHSHQANETEVIFNDGHVVQVINSGADYNAPTFHVVTI